MFTREFWIDAAERSISTFAQTLLAIVAVAAPLSGLDLNLVNWLPVLAASGLAALLSIMKALAIVVAKDKV